MLEQIQTDTGAALDDLRDLARGIYPPLLADKGLAAALESQARKASIPVTVDAEGVGRFSQEIEAAVYFSVSRPCRTSRSTRRPRGPRSRCRAANSS